MATSSKVPPQHRSSAAPAIGDMVSCKICSRHFNPERIYKHQEICERTQIKKRKVFNAAKHRVKGTDVEQYVNKSTKVSDRYNTVKPQSSGHQQDKKADWRRKHAEFIEAIQAAKKMQIHLARGGKLSDLPPPLPSENPDYVECPHCYRRFNEAAAERHIPKCAGYLHNKPKTNAARSNNKQR